MRDRVRINETFDAGERNGVLDAVAPELLLEVLLDIGYVLVRMYNESDDYGLETIEYDD